MMLGMNTTCSDSLISWGDDDSDGEVDWDLDYKIRENFMIKKYAEVSIRNHFQKLYNEIISQLKKIYYE